MVVASGVNVKLLTVLFFIISTDLPPALQIIRSNVNVDGCSLLCLSDKKVNIRWYKDNKIVNKNSSVQSLAIIVNREDQNSSFTCVASNSEGNESLFVNVTDSCKSSPKENCKCLWDSLKNHCSILILLKGSYFILFFFLLQTDLTEVIVILIGVAAAGIISKLCKYYFKCCYFLVIPDIWYLCCQYDCFKHLCITI